MAPPTLPKVFISAESVAEWSGTRSMQAAQKFAAANIRNPAASAIMGSATEVFAVWLPEKSRAADSPIPSHTALWRPRRLPKFREMRSENSPPKGEIKVMARNGNEVQAAAGMMPSPRTFTA